MGFSSKNADHPKKERKKKKSAEKLKVKSDSVPSMTSKSEAQTVAPPIDVVVKNILLQKSKTLIDFRRKSKTLESEPEFQDTMRSDWSQLSFRKRINQFIQNSPLLKRANYLKHTPSLKTSLDRLSDSLESLKIDEGRVLTTDPPRVAPEQRKKASKKLLSKSCNDFYLNKSDDRAMCPKCSESENISRGSPTTAKSGSLWNLSSPSDKTNGKVMKRSASLHLSVGPWTWISVSYGLIFFNPQDEDFWLVHLSIKSIAPKILPPPLPSSANQSFF